MAARKDVDAVQRCLGTVQTITIAGRNVVSPSPFTLELASTPPGILITIWLP